MNKLVIIDGNSLFYRSFYALPLLSNSNGEYSNAVYGFAIQIVKIIEEIKPSHICVAFDAGKYTFRNDMYNLYKANRKPMPSELASQIAPLKNMLKLMNIGIYEKAGVEGDDIVGTLSKKFADTECIIVTADRDTLQLISATTNVYFTKKGTSTIKKVDLQVLKDEYGIEPQQIIELKALQGDASDNIPGVAGIGEKIALKLIQQYGSLENIYANIDATAPRVKQNLTEGKDNAFLSRRLATIKTDVDLDVNLDDCKYVFPFDNSVYDFFVKYEFKSLLKRTELFAEKEQETATKVYKIVQISDQNGLKMLQKLQNCAEFGYYLDKNTHYFSDGETEYVVDLSSNTLNASQAKKVISSLVGGKNLVVVFDNKQTRHNLLEQQIEFGYNIFDVSIAKHLCDGSSVKSVMDIFIDSADKLSPASVILAHKQEYAKSLQNLGMNDLYNNVEIPLSFVLFDMERVGFKIDQEVLNNLSEAYKAELAALEQQIYDLIDFKFNINSPKQLAEVIYDKLGLPNRRKRSTAAEYLEMLNDKHPIIPLILRYRKIAKLNSTYIEGFRPHIDSNSFVHTCFKQTLTNTGRLSSTEPNLQNIPVRSQEGNLVRSMFVASSKDNVLIDADYSQIELRLLAHLSGDEYFIDAFNTGKDIHSLTASTVFGVPISDVTKSMRRVAKVVNFGIIYGISGYGLSTDLNISAKDATKMINQFYDTHPKVKDYLSKQVQLAKETGRVSTILGRSRNMSEINSSNYLVRSFAERASQNMPLQGSAADIVKLAMIKVARSLKEKGLKAKLILQVHDELIVDSPKSEEEQVKQIVKQCMESAYKLSVPLTVDVTSSYRWSEGH